MAETILVVDNDRWFARLAELYLGNSGFEVLVNTDGLESLRSVLDLHPDLVVLDPRTADCDNIAACQQVREISDVPLIIVSAQGGDSERITSLETGADDFLAKPFNPQELVARVKAILRRTHAPARAPKSLCVGPLVLNCAERQASLDGRPLKLRPKEYGLLKLLASQPGTTLSKADLFKSVWGQEYCGDDRTLAVHVTWLRAKLGGGSVRLVSVRGIGYKLVVS